MITRFYTCALATLLTAATLTPAAAQAPKKPAAKPTAPVNPYQAVDARMQQLPDSAGRSVGGVARFITAAFSTDADKARAAFGWVARTLRYDVDNMYVIGYQREPAELVQEALTRRRGVCTHYAELYSALANQLGLPTYVVTGYGKERNGAPQLIGHAWAATRLDGQWYLMDPTWAAGYVVEETFVPRLNNEFYLVKPATFIRTHMPFDPLWQLLPTPRTPTQFVQGSGPAAGAAATFSVADSLAAYARQSPLERLRATIRRVEQQGVRNDITFSYLTGARAQEDGYYVTAYNEAANELRAGVERLNAFIDFYNHQFQPRKADAELEQLLPPIGAHLARSRQQLAAVRFADAARQTSVQQAYESLQQADAKLLRCQAFMARYLRTGKLLRPAMFTNLDAPRNEMLR
jgi:hypothetical protein